MKSVVSKLLVSNTLGRGGLAVSLLVSGMGGAVAAPVDLSTWTVNSMGSADWVLQTPATDGVQQESGGNPTVFFESGSDALGKSFSGNVSVQTTSDDDYFGFVLGYDAGELGASDTDFMLIDWKQTTQSIRSCDGEAKGSLGVKSIDNIFYFAKYSSILLHLLFQPMN